MRNHEQPRSRVMAPTAGRTTQFTVREPPQPYGGPQFSVKAIRGAKTFFISTNPLNADAEMMLN